LLYSTTRNEFLPNIVARRLLASNVRCLARRERLLATLFYLLLCGCSTPAFVHEDYARLRPQTVALASIENRTVYPLRGVRFGGAIQRSLLGARPHDIPFLLLSSLGETLTEKGYRVVEQPGTPSAGTAAEATVVCTIESWNARTGSLPYMKLRYRLELRRNSNGAGNGKAELFRTTSTAAGDGRSSRRFLDVEGSIRASVRRALRELPDA